MTAPRAADFTVIALAVLSAIVWGYAALQLTAAL